MFFSLRQWRLTRFHSRPQVNMIVVSYVLSKQRTRRSGDVDRAVFFEEYRDVCILFVYLAREKKIRLASHHQLRKKIKRQSVMQLEQLLA